MGRSLVLQRGMGVWTERMSLIVDVKTSGRAHLPEAEAYRRFLAKNTFETGSKSVRLSIRFMGFALGRRLVENEADVVIADYPSASTGRLRWSRDWAKRHLSARPDLAVVCGEYVGQRVAPIGARTLRREMGFFSESIKPRNDVAYDVVYAGTTRRAGVEEALLKLSRMGLRIAVASADPVKELRGVTALGQMDVESLYDLYSRCQVGLNVAPDRPPFSYQASTKVIEYCAAGLGVLTTRTPWIETFEANRGGRFLDLGDANSAHHILWHPYRAADVSDLAWDDIFMKCSLSTAIQDLLDADG